jgi:hypothetical protein
MAGLTKNTAHAILAGRPLRNIHLQDSDSILSPSLFNDSVSITKLNSVKLNLESDMTAVKWPLWEWKWVQHWTEVWPHNSNLIKSFDMIMEEIIQTFFCIVLQDLLLSTCTESCLPVHTHHTCWIDGSASVQQYLSNVQESALGSKEQGCRARLGKWNKQLKASVSTPRHLH